MTTTTSPHRSRSSRTRALMVVFTAFALFLAACGSDSDAKSANTGSDDTKNGSATTDDTGVDEARERVALAEAEYDYAPLGEAFTVDSSIEGSLIVAILNDVSAPFTQSVVDGMKAAAKEFDIKIDVVDGERSAATASSEIEKAIARKPAAIIIGAFQTEALSAALDEAAKAGIPVIEQANREGGPLPQEVLDLGILNSVGFCYRCAGELLADSVIADSGGGATIGVVNINDVPVSNSVTEAFKAQVDDICEDCKVEVFDTPAATTTPAAIDGIVTSFTAKNSGDLYIVSTFDYYIPQLASALNAANAVDRVSLLGWNATNAPMELLRDEGPVLADVGASPDLMGWATIDSILRIFSGEEPVEDAQIPVRVFNANNIGDIDLKAHEAEWYGGEHAEQFRELWIRD